MTTNLYLGALKPSIAVFIFTVSLKAALNNNDIFPKVTMFLGLQWSHFVI
jgi:hypothetical protein